ncbi:tRNA-dihydrouridine synthase [Staphylococcus pseudintermedius]|nr:tRNA-dihydrouridine synthase [Staphylococcus pseudintermedius]
MSKQVGSERVKRGMAEMQKGGVIMDVVNAEQAKIAEEAGAVAVMALERVPSDIRAAGGVARACNPSIVEEVMNAVSIPVMAKCRIGEGAAMLRTKGEPGTGNIVEAVRHMRQVNQEVKRITVMSDDELMTEAKNLGAPYEILKDIKKHGRLPVVNFAAGGVATPQDAALMMELGADGVFVGSGIFKSEDPETFAKAIVQATTHYQDYKLIGELAKKLGTAMKGIDINQLSLEERMQERGW